MKLALLFKSLFGLHFGCKILEATQIEIFGREVKEQQSKNNELIFWTLLIFHLEISAKDVKEEQP